MATLFLTGALFADEIFGILMAHGLQKSGIISLAPKKKD